MKCRRNACIANGRHREGERGRPARNGTSPNDKPADCAETVLPPLLSPIAILIEVGLLFANFIRPRRASPHGAALLMWRMAPDPPSRATGRRGRPTGARDRRASPLRPARILSLRPPNRPSQSQRKHLESNLEGGRKTDRQTEREERPRPLEGSGGNRSRPSIRSSAQSAAEEIKFSAGDLFPFSCQRSTARRLARSSLACEWRSRRGDGRTDNGRGLPACSSGCSAPHYTKTNYSDPRKKNVSFKF